MSKEFKHPLARRAKVWAAKTREGAQQNLLIVVTTLELDPEREAFSQKHFDRLAKAAEEFVAATPDLQGYALVNRGKDWDD